MATNVEEPWSPEPELREAPPRRVRPSEFPDLNAPNVKVFTLGGVALMVAGVALLVMGMSNKGAAMIVAGVVAAALGAVALALPGRKAAQAKERAERLVRNGQPIMARLISAENLTGDSTYARICTYMVSLPGGETVRREVNADERALPKRIPTNATVLVDPDNTSDVELYCALPLRAVPRVAPAPADPLADLPTGAATPSADGDGQMGNVAPDPKPAAAPGSPQQSAPQPQPPQNKSGYQGLPWE